jgi:3-mercaptopyruvate sulfurtransferase SseA
MSITASQLLTPAPGTTIVNAGAHSGRREILGAIRYDPKELLAADHLALPIAHDGAVILYAEHGLNATLTEVAAKMRAAGFTDVNVYAGTLADYEQAGGITQESSTQQIVPPSKLGAP